MCVRVLVVSGRSLNEPIFISRHIRNKCGSRINPFSSHGTYEDSGGKSAGGASSESRAYFSGWMILFLGVTSLSAYALWDSSVVSNGFFESLFTSLLLASVVSVLAFFSVLIFYGIGISWLPSLGSWVSPMLIGLLWWVWHIPFGNNIEPTSFFIMIVGGSLLIAKFVEATKSFLTTAGIHSIMNIGSNTDWTKTFLIDLTIIFVAMFIIDKTWKNETNGTEKHYS